MAATTGGLVQMESELGTAAEGLVQCNNAAPMPGGDIATSIEPAAAAAMSSRSRPARSDGKVGSALLLVGRAPEEAPAMRVWRQAESLYRSLAERIKAVTYVISLDAGNPVLFVSSQLESFGFPPERWIANHDFRLQACHDDDRQMLADAISRSLQGQEAVSCDYRIRCSSGEVRWVREEAHLIRDANGNPILLQGVIVDTTRDKVIHDELNVLRHNLEQQVAHRTRALQRRLEILESCNAVLCERLDDAHAQNDAWRQVQARYDYIMRLPGEAVVFIDQHYKIVDLTEVACNLAGWDRISAVQHQVQEVFQLTDSRGRTWEMADHLNELADEMGADVCIKYLDGSLAPVRARLSLLGTGGATREYVLSLEKLGTDWSVCGE